MKTLISLSSMPTFNDFKRMVTSLHIGTIHDIRESTEEETEIDGRAYIAEFSSDSCVLLSQLLTARTALDCDAHALQVFISNKKLVLAFYLE